MGEIPHEIHEWCGRLVILGQSGGRVSIPTRQLEVIGAPAGSTVGAVRSQDIVSERHVRDRATDFGDVDEPERNPEVATHKILDLTDIGPPRGSGLHREVEVDEGKLEGLSAKGVLETM